MKPKRPWLLLSSPALALCLLWAGSTWAAAAPGAVTLETLFEQERYTEFQAQAESEAARGSAEALFLLGKAAHLGKGRPADAEAARALYQQAREKGSARASHNLGVMALDDKQPDEAIALFEEALARGFRMPTLLNLARAHEPEDPFSFFDLESAAASARRAGDLYAQAFEISGEFDHGFDASRQYLRAYIYGRKAPGDAAAQGLPEARALAVKWLQRGMDANHGPSWTNYGALLLEEEDYPAARVALQKGAEQKIPIAMYHLGNMARDGLGMPARDSALALSYYEPAALLGLEEARVPALQILEGSLQHEKDLIRLEQGAARMKALQKPEDFEPLNPPDERLAWGRFLEAARTNPVPVPDLPIRLEICGFGINDVYGLEYNITENTPWRLVAYQQLGEAVELGVASVVNDKGCISQARPLQGKVRELLGAGAVLALWFPNYTLPLAWEQQGQRVVLKLLPPGTVPLPKD